jgi:hypothetical protein
LSSRRWLSPIVPVPGSCWADEEDEWVAGDDVGGGDALVTGRATNPPPLLCACDVLVDG